VGRVEYRLLLLFRPGCAGGRISLEQLVAITATNPAKLFGRLTTQGSLMVGADADLVILDPGGETRLSVSSSPPKVDYSIYEGWTVAGAIRRVLQPRHGGGGRRRGGGPRGHGRRRKGPTLSKQTRVVTPGKRTPQKPPASEAVPRGLARQHRYSRRRAESFDRPEERW